MNSVMEKPGIEQLADELFLAQQSRSTVAPLTARFADLSIEDAYRIQQTLQIRQEQSGATVIGRKIGVTSLAVQEMLGVHQPDFGFLTDTMKFGNEAVISLSRSLLVQPRAEGEIAFLLKDELKGPGVTRDDVLNATSKVTPCFEIVDSRIADWKIKIQDTIADNASCGVFVLGECWIDPSTLDLAEVVMEMSHNGQRVATGKGSAVQGHPAEAVAWLANTLGEFGISLRPGDIILSGALGRMVDAHPGDSFSLRMSGLGKASVHFVE